MAKFNLSTDKQLVVRGGLVSLKAGEVDTEDADLIKALSGAIDVFLVDDEEDPEPEPEKPRRNVSR